MITHLLNRELAVWRPQFSPDGAGGRERTMAEQGMVRGKVDQASAAEQELAQRWHADLTHSVYLEPDADVLRGDELRGGGQTLRVIGVVEPSTPRYRKALCQQQQPEGG